MRRRDFLKVAGVSVFSLAGLERLAQAMAASEPLAAVVEAEDCGDAPSFHCGDNETRYTCNNFDCARGKDQTFVCNPPQNGANFNCYASFNGCNAPGDFICAGNDTQVSQFMCYNEFDGCRGAGGVFSCDDFTCRVNYHCGKGNTCPQYPFYCATPYTA